MKKKMYVVGLAVALMISLSGCGSQPTAETQDKLWRIKGQRALKRCSLLI